MKTVIGSLFGRKPAPTELTPSTANDIMVAHASREFFDAVAARKAAENTFNNLTADAEYTLIDAAINDMNIATMRVDNASRRLRELTGLPSPEQLRELRGAV